MSQAKVDKYKQEKAKRKQTLKKEKMQRVLRRCAAGIVAIALVAGFGYSAYNIYESKKPKEEITVDYSAVTSLSQALSESGTSAE